MKNKKHRNRRDGDAKKLFFEHFRLELTPLLIWSTNRPFQRHTTNLFLLTASRSLLILVGRDILLERFLV
ncbi:MAG: hypothetical protein M3Q91_03440, partial [Acidobacteriota bacterium]|nr:hypothetical protein [Acidobacteriota bacterium]